MFKIIQHSFSNKTLVFTGVAAVCVDNSFLIIYTMLTDIGAAFKAFLRFQFTTKTISKFKQFLSNCFINFFNCLHLSPSPTMPP